MWFFDLFKKRRKEAVLNELEKADDLGSIAKILAENDLISPTDDAHNSFGDDLNHLTESGDLPFGWVAYNSEFTERQEKRIDSKWNAVASASSASAKLSAFNEYFDTVSKVGKVCKRAGECHYKWFCEDIIDSRWYNDQLAKYERFKAEAPALIRRDELLPTLEADVMRKLQDCHGILQSDFLKLFDPVIKKDISEFLYNAEKAGRIKRTKSGRSYIIELK